MIMILIYTMYYTIVSCYKRTIALNYGLVSIFFVAILTCFMRVYIESVIITSKTITQLAGVVIGRHAWNVFHSKINVYSCGFGQEFNIKVSLD